MQKKESLSLCVRKRQTFFVNREAPSWEILPANVINSLSLNGFKKSLDKLRKNGRHY